MNPLEKARARLREVAAALDALWVKAGSGTITADDLAAIEAKTAEMETAEREVAVLLAAETARARVAVAAGMTLATGGGNNVDPTIDAVPQQKMEPDAKLSLLAAATLKAKAHKIPALKILEDEGYSAFAREIGALMRKKAIDTTAIDVLIPEVLSSQIIELLRPETAFFQGNPRRVQFTRGQYKAPRGLTGATASYVGEGEKKPVTEPTFDSMQMSAKKLAAIVLITQEARDWSLPNIDAYIREDLRMAMSQAIDLNAFFGTGTGSSPTGIFNIDGVPYYTSTDFVASPFEPTVAEIDAALSRLVLSLTEANIGSSPTRWKWLMAYRTLEYLKNKRVDSGTGMPAYPTLHLPVPVLKGFEVLVTNQVAINTGGGTDETTISLIDFRHVLYAEEGGIMVKTSDEATVDVAGTLVHTWQQNMYAILTEHQHDFGLRHLEAVAQLRNVRWGADTLGEAPDSP